MPQLAKDVRGIGALAEPVRRELYLYVCAQPAAVGREQAAEATGVPLHKAKFHLDKLEAEGLLQTEFVRLSGRRGPGAGRPAKLYRRVDREIAVSLPGRAYELAGQLLAEAVAESAATGAPVLEALSRAAEAHGRAMGAARPVHSAPRDASEALELACRALTDHGYEPRRLPDRVELANCPFHALAKTHPQMVCGMNHALLRALTDTLAPGRLVCDLEPAADRCCVILRAREVQD